jgi:mannose/cellobiose epimerase-like protein (N-acyl-D-glucosamine 2-epimerase family)
VKELYLKALEEVRHHLKNELLPFWQQRALDREFGGFLTYFDKNGDPTGETDKALLTQARCLYSFSAAHRAGYGDGRFLELAQKGFEFLTRNFWDAEHQGWFWIVDREGIPVDPSKVVYGHAFVIYGLSEYFLASQDKTALRWANLTLSMLQNYAADIRFGGYFELMERDWSLKPGGEFGGDRKSFDVHMHLMEAFTKLYEASGQWLHKRCARQIIGLIFSHIIHPEYNLGISQFDFGWKPLQAILFKTVWGADRDVKGREGRPPDNTSYGHNVEFGWLLNEAVGICDLDRSDYLDRIKALYDHCLEYGIDWEKGGVFCEGPFEGPARERNKEFWQQAETLVAMLDAFELFGEEKYWKAYENVHRFVFDVVIDHKVGEWRPLLGPDNSPLREYMATAWKVNYHTIRAMLECEKRLQILIDKGGKNGGNSG